MRRSFSIAAVAATLAGLTVFVAQPAWATDPPIVHTATRVYVEKNTTMDFTGSDTISGEVRAISVENLKDDTDPNNQCDDSAGNDYSELGCADLQMSLNTDEAGLLKIPGLTKETDSNSVKHIVSPDGAIIYQITHDTPIAPSPLIYMHGTPKQINDTLATLQFIPKTDYVENRLASDDGTLPHLTVLALDGGSLESLEDTKDTYIKVGTANQAPEVAVHVSKQVAAGAKDVDVTDDVNLLDPEMCTATICGLPYTNNNPIADTSASMLLVAWLDADCGTFNFFGSSIPNKGSVSNANVDDLLLNTQLDENDDLGYNLKQRTAIETSIGATAKGLDLSGQTDSDTTVWAGIGHLEDLDYVVSHLQYSAPDSTKTCRIHFSVSDLGNLGTPTKYDESTNPAREIPDAKGDTNTLVLDVVDTHPHVTVEQVPPSPPGPEPDPGIDPTHISADFLITFDQNVDDFDASDLNTGDSAASGTGPIPVPGSLPVSCGLVNIVPNQVWTASCIGLSHTGQSKLDDGTIKLKIDAGKAHATGHDGDDAYANRASTSDDNSVGWDVTVPTVTIDPDTDDGQTNPATTSPIKYTVEFSETTDAPFAFDSSDVDLSASTAGGNLVAHVSGPVIATVPPHPNRYIVSVTGMTTAGDVIATIKPGVVLDEALNPSEASTSTDGDNVISWEPATTTGPTVEIDQEDSQPDPVPNGPIYFQASFSTPVTGFDNSDIDLSASTQTSGLTATVNDMGDHQNYQVVIDGMSQTGTVIVSIPAGAALDASDSNKQSIASTSFDNSVVYIQPSASNPTVTIDQPAGQDDPTNQDTVAYSVKFSAPVTGFGKNDITFTGSTATGPIAATKVTGSGDTYTVTVGGYTGDGIVQAEVRPGAATTSGGDPSVASTSTDNKITVDRTAPKVDIEQGAAQAGATKSGPITFTATFDEDVTGFTAADVDLTASTAGGPLVAAVTGGPKIYTIKVTGMSSDGTVVASIGTDAAKDAAGNKSNASSSTDNSVTYDTTAPTVTIDKASGQTDPSSGSPIKFAVVFSEPVTDFGAGGIDLTASDAGPSLLPTITGGPTTYEVDVSGMTKSGDVVAKVAAAAAKDLAGNTSTASTSTDNSVSWIKLIASHVVVTPSPASAVFGQTVTASAAVTVDSGSALGSVQFAVDGVDVGSPVAVVSGTATGPTLTGPSSAPLEPGSRTVAATFLPSDQGAYNGSFGTSNVVVDKADSTTAVTIGAHSLTATITAKAPGAGQPSGTVTFSVDGTPVGTAPVSSGTATLTFTTPSGQSHSVAAAYGGDDHFLASSASTSRHDPTITAHVSSAHAKTAYGWYRSSVTVTFTCVTNGSPLVGSCPAAVTLTHNGAAQSVSRTISATDGGMATVTVKGISIDQIKPIASATGVTNGATYPSPGPSPHCHATDSLSGVLSCHLVRHTVGSTVSYTVTATDKAGNVRTISGHFLVSSISISGVVYSNGAYTVHRNHTYLMVVTSSTRPTYIDAAPYPQKPFHPDNYPFRYVGHGKWTLPVLMTANLSSHVYWNIGFRIGSTIHVLKLRVLA